MSNLPSNIFERYNLPLDYSIKLAQKKDDLDIFEYTHSISKKYIYGFLIVIYPVSILLMLPAGYSAWKVWHKSIVFESGIKLLSSPDLIGWLYIILQAAKFALLLLAICIFSYVLTFIGLKSYYQQIASSNDETIIPDHWIVKYREQVVGEIIFNQKISYSRLLCLSIHPRHRNFGLGSYLLWIALHDVDKPVYLLCRPKMQNFYRRIGFVSLTCQQIPMSLKLALWYKVMGFS